VIVRGDNHSPGAEPGFDWRVSIATVECDGDFSPYPGVDRWLMPLSAGGLRLIEDGELMPVGQHEVHAFPGERAVTSVGVTEPTLDLNLMVRRGETTGSLCSAEVAGRAELATAAGEELVILVLNGVVDAALDTVELGDLAARPVAQLSGGQQRRVTIARALAAEPDLLILDEPTAGVDAENQVRLADTLARAAAGGTTIVLVAHELGPAAPLIARVVVLRDGGIAYDGPADRGAHDHHHAVDELGCEHQHEHGEAPIRPGTGLMGW